MMCRFILRRLAQSLLILLGIMILTFVLFRLTTGDPTGVLLGKNPAPSEVELLRRRLGVDKPLFFGRECVTERFAPIDFIQNKIPKTVQIIGTTDTPYTFGKGSLQIIPQFQDDETKYVAHVQTPTRIYNIKFNALDTLFLTAQNTQIPTNAPIEMITFSRLQKSPFNNQLFDTFKELVCFQEDFPYLSFFNYGNSLTQQEPVKEILWRGVAPSLLLMVPIFLGELFLGIALALVATRFKDGFWDRAIMILSVLGMSISYLAFIILGQYLLAYRMGCFPIWGFESAVYLALPILIGIISGLGGGIRFYRTVFVNELNREYLRTAKAKGCSNFRIYFHHLLPNTFIPIISRISVTLPFLFTGSLLLEKFFGIPGLGFTGINALANADLQLIKAIVLLSSILFIIINLLTDIVYAWVDPRVRVDR